MNTTKEVKAVEKVRAKLNVILNRYKKKNAKINDNTKMEVGEGYFTIRVNHDFEDAMYIEKVVDEFSILLHYDDEVIIEKANNLIILGPLFTVDSNFPVMEVACEKAFYNVTKVLKGILQECECEEV